MSFANSLEKKITASDNSVGNTAKSVCNNHVSASAKKAEDIKRVPTSVVEAIRAELPFTAGKADLLTAFVYIFKNGGCELTPKAAEIVKKYQREDSLANVKERLGHIENLLRENREQLYAIELCTNFDLYDRRFGAKQPRKRAEEIDFCEPDGLKMLEKLRYQGREQRKIDNMRRGRNIYAETKDKNDKNN